MSFVFNPLTGQFDIAGSSGGGGGGSNYKVEQFTLTALQASNKAVTLSIAPTTAAYTVLTVEGGGGQAFSIDYTVTGSTVSWSGLGLDGFLDESDTITIIHD